jgi:hypothetical protein
MIRQVERLWQSRETNVQDRIVEGFEENKVMDSVVSKDASEFKEGETIIDLENTRPIIKVNGILNKLAVDTNNNIILEEII